MKKEKARVLACRQDNVTIKEICKLSGRTKPTLIALLKEGRKLPPDVVPDHKQSPGRPRKTPKHTDKLLKRELLKTPRLTASQLKTNHP